ncbi:MAG TPA: hypothetical protein VHJ77_13755 [Vicinamibacterales bacterium]|nr:hypothetical protein [Vicinamibacterales bacterium]
MRGASATQDVLDEYPEQKVKVFSVWLPILRSDQGPPGRSALGRLSDDRASHYWDPDKLVAARLARDARSPQPVQECCVRSGTLWDIAAVYPPGVLWTDRLPVAIVFDGPVVGKKGAIRSGLMRFQ